MVLALEVGDSMPCLKAGMTKISSLAAKEKSGRERTAVLYEQRISAGSRPCAMWRMCTLFGKYYFSPYRWWCGLRIMPQGDTKEVIGPGLQPGRAHGLA